MAGPHPTLIRLHPSSRSARCAICGQLARISHRRRPNLDGGATASATAVAHGDGPRESSSARHTRRMDGGDDLRTPGGLAVPAISLSWSFARARGPGGQHVNKTATRVTLAVELASLRGAQHIVERVQSELGEAIRVTSQTTRSQWRNRQECLAQAAELIDQAAVPTSSRRPSRPTRGSVERRLAAKRRDSQKKLGRRSSEW